MPKRTEPIYLLRKTGPGGRLGQHGSRNTRTGARRLKSKFTATLEVDRDWPMFVDSRHLGAEVGDGMIKHFRSTIGRDVNPETGQRNPRTFQTKSGRWLERPADRPGFMLKHLTRTITHSEGRWMGKGGRQVISLHRTNMRFYFNSLQANAINKYDSDRKGKGRAVYLGTGGQVQRIIGYRVGRWLDLVVAGKKPRDDSRARALGKR